MLTTAQLGKAFLAEDMERAIRSILDVHGVLDAFDAAKNFYIKIESSGFMPLTIEKHGRQIVVAHYYEQNGDLVPDPDMSFIKTDLGWIPMAIQHSSGSYYIASEQQDGKLFLYPRQARDQAEFSKIWAHNLMCQGFSDLTCSKLLNREAS